MELLRDRVAQGLLLLVALASACGSKSLSVDGGAGGSTGGSGGGGGGCSYNGNTYAVGSSFPSVDGCNTCGCSAGGGVACTEKACLPDGGAGDHPATCALDTTYHYGPNGGRVRYQDQVTLAPPASYMYQRSPVSTDPPELSCTPPLPACGDATAIDVADIMRDIADPDIQKALAQATPPLYGRDARPVDGTVFQFLRNDGRGFLAGGPCDVGGGACAAIPAGVSQLVADLNALDQQQLKDPTCAALRP